MPELKLKSLALGLCIAIGGMAVGRTVDAATIVGPLTDPTGVDGLLVDGKLYNVTFLKPNSYNEAYSATPPYFLGNMSLASDAALALLSALNSLGPSFPPGEMILGEAVFVPYALTGGTVYYVWLYGEGVGGWSKGAPFNDVMDSGGSIINGRFTQFSLAPYVTGTIKVAGAATTGFTGLRCGDIVVDVSSKEQTSSPPGWTGPWFATPKWQRQANATGSWASGSCSYQVAVPAKSEFDVYLLPSIREVPCGGYDTVTSTPAQAGWFKVDAGDEKTQDFTLDSVACTRLE